MSNEGATEEQELRSLLDYGVEWRDAQHAVRHCSVPVIAAVEGPVIGAGFGLVGVCDIIIASEAATFGLTEINIGLLGGASKALRMLGPFKTRSMFFTGRMLSAAELYRFGAVEEVVEVGEAEAHARVLAQEFAGKSPIAMRLAKESLLRIEGHELEDRYRTEQDYVTRIRTFSDSAEAMQAFIDRRPPVWTWH
jgi:enoyl-CoA hydratase